MSKRSHNGDIPRQSSTRWELVIGWIDPVTDDMPVECNDIRSDGDILEDVRQCQASEAQQRDASSGSIPFEYLWEPDVDAFRPSQVRHHN
jgi:hypothetical protein